MITEYLNERKKIVEKVINKNKEKLENNKITIFEFKKQIKQLDNTIDEASEIFSVRARVDSGYKNHEINDLEIKISDLLNVNKEIEKNIEIAEKELETIIKSIMEFKNDYVSRETKYKRRRPSIKKEVIEKLKLCKEVVSFDSARVSIELEEILRLLN